MESTEAIKCFSCKKDVAGNLARCTACRHLFRPGCFKPHRVLTSKGDRTTCSGSAEAVRRSSSTLALPSALPSASQGSASSEPSLSSILAAVQACMAQVDTVRTQLEDKLTSQLGSLQKDISSRIERVSTELKAVATRVQEMETRVDNLQGDVKVISAKHDALSTTLTSRMTVLGNEQKSYADAVKTLSRRVCLLEEEKRASEVVVSGLPQQPEEDLHRLVVAVATSVGVPLARENIVRVSRMRGSDDPERPRLVHVVLSTRHVRDALLAGKRKKGKVTAAEVDPTLASRPIYINEYLPRDVLALLRLVRSEARSRGYSFNWHRAGVIYVKKDNDSKAIAIHSSEELTAKLE